MKKLLNGVKTALNSANLNQRIPEPSERRRAALLELAFESAYFWIDVKFSPLADLV